MKWPRWISLFCFLYQDLTLRAREFTNARILKFGSTCFIQKSIKRILASCKKSCNNLKLVSGSQQIANIHNYNSNNCHIFETKQNVAKFKFVFVNEIFWLSYSFWMKFLTNVHNCNKNNQYEHISKRDNERIPATMPSENSWLILRRKQH